LYTAISYHHLPTLLSSTTPRADERGVRGYAAPEPSSVAGSRGGERNCVKMKNVLKDSNK